MYTYFVSYSSMPPKGTSGCPEFGNSRVPSAHRLDFDRIQELEKKLSGENSGRTVKILFITEIPS